MKLKANLEVDEMKVKVKLEENGKLPQRVHDDDSGFDLYASETVEIKTGEVKLVPTGVRIAIPNGFEAQVRPKSGLALKNGITVLNTPGTIDAGYRGTIGIITINHGKETFIAEKGKKIAQMVFCKVEHPELETVKELNETKRNTGGFGSTKLH